MARFTVDFTSYVLQRTVSVTAVIPSARIGDILKGKTVKHTPQYRYPVVYLLHGFGGNHTDWLRYTSAERYAEERNIALVCAGNENHLYLNNSGHNWFDFYTEELPEFVTGMFPISGRPEDTCLCGYSNGGYGTLLYALNCPEKYAAIGCLSGTHSPLRTILNDGKLQIVHDHEAGQRYFPDQMIRKLAAEGKRLPKAYIACGGQDAFFQKNKAFYELLKENGFEADFHEIENLGHDWRFWDRETELFLDWLPRTDQAASGNHQEG